jgi:hypothetical protein
MYWLAKHNGNKTHGDKTYCDKEYRLQNVLDCITQWQQNVSGQNGLRQSIPATKCFGLYNIMATKHIGTKRIVTKRIGYKVSWLA